MIIGTNITSWMESFVVEVLRIMSSCFSMLDSIQFANTSVLRVIIGVAILGAILPVLLTIAKTFSSNYTNIIASNERSKRNDTKSK